MKKNHSPQILRINYFSPPPSLHPHYVTDIGTHTLCKALFEGLTRINPQGNTELAIAKKIQISSCKKIYTFTLRSTKWSNGEKVTSHHFSRSWKRSLFPKCYHAKRLFLIKNARKIHAGLVSSDEIGIYTPSDTQLVVELEHPAPYFLQLLADPVYSPLYDSNSDEEPTVFNGPFIIENYEFNKQIDLSANPLYWDTKQIKLKKVQITLVKDMQTALSMFENNQSDWIGSPFTNISDEAVQALSNVKSQKASAPFWIFCNTKNPKLKSPKLRKALAYAINREEMVKHIFPYQKPLYTILPKEISSLDPKYSLKNVTVKIAQQFFEEALKENNLIKSAFKLVLSHSNIPEQERLATYLKHLWEKTFDIKIILKKDEWNNFYSNIKSGNYEIGGFYLFNLYDDSFYFMESFDKIDNNHARWENKDYQNHLDQIKYSTDQEHRKYYLEKAEMILMEEMPVIPIYNHTHLYTCKDNLEGFSPPKFNYADFKWAYFSD